MAAAYGGYRLLGSDLLPEMDEGGFILDYIMPAGSSLAETNQVLTGVETILRDTPEVESTSRRTGLQLGLAAVTEANTGDISVKLKRKRDRGVDEVISEVRDKVTKRYPMLDAEFVQLTQDMIGDLTSVPEPIAIKLFSQDPALLKQWAPQVAEAIKKLPGVVDVLDGIENTISGPATLFKVDQGMAARAGSRRRNSRPTSPRSCRASRRRRRWCSTIAPTRSASAFPSRRARRSTRSRARCWSARPGAPARSARWRRSKRCRARPRCGARTCSATSPSPRGWRAWIWAPGVAAAQRAIAELHMPPSIRVAYGGAYEEQQKSFKDLLLVLVLAVVLVFTVLLFEFGDFAAPTAVIASALLSTVGVFLALLVTRTTFNLSSFMGLIMVIGIVAKNGILLLDADQRFRAEGLSPEESMIQAGERRLRPI